MRASVAEGNVALEVQVELAWSNYGLYTSLLVLCFRWKSDAVDELENQ